MLASRPPCRRPTFFANAAVGRYEQAVSVEIALNGEDFTDGGAMFAYYRHPVLTTLSPSRGSASRSQRLTVTRSAAVASGPWEPAHLLAPAKHLCRFESVLDPDGHRQVTYSNTTAATVADATELTCRTPEVNFLGPVTVEVSLNGLDFSNSSLIFTYDDHWHAPATSGEYAEREGMAAAVLGDGIYLFGGVDVEAFFDVSGPFSSDMYVLHTDAMKEIYPSRHAEDLTWQKLSLITGGEPPPQRTRASLVSWGSSLLLFGGLVDNQAEALNETRQFVAARQAWETVSVSGGPVAKRSGHTAHVCSLDVNCTTVDGKPRMFVFGGWGLTDCGQSRPCLRHRDDLMALELTQMVWSEVAVNAEQPRPYARKGHSSAVVNGSHLVLFGGSAFVPDDDEENSYGWTTKQVNDVWRIDLSGADGFTWHAVPTVGDRPTPREGQASALLAGRYLVVHGGYVHPDDHTSGFMGSLGSTHVLDTAVDPMVWTQPVLTGSAPSPRHGHAALSIRDEIYFIGGFGDQGYESDVHVLKLAPPTAPAPPSPPPPPE